MRPGLKGALRLLRVENLSTRIEGSASGESLNSGDPAVHPASRHRSHLNHVLLCKFSSGQASILSFVVAVVAVRRQMLNSSPSRAFLDADSFTGFVKGPRRSCYNPTRFCARFVCKFGFLQQPYCSQYNSASKTRLTANAKNLPNQSLFASTHDPSTHDLFQSMLNCFW